MLCFFIFAIFGTLSALKVPNSLKIRKIYVSVKNCYNSSIPFVNYNKPIRNTLGFEKMILKSFSLLGLGTLSFVKPISKAWAQTNLKFSSSKLLVENHIKKRPTDERNYKYLILANDLKILLISDSTSTRSAAAIDVHVGSFSDPKQVPGIAHFCEHMSFLGTKKFPKEDEFGFFLSSHGGSSNAYTAAEDTVYVCREFMYLIYLFFYIFFTLWIFNFIEKYYCSIIINKKLEVQFII
jgi:hypothetical protein